MALPLTFQPVRSEQDIAQAAALAHAIWNEHFPAVIGQAQVDYILERFQSVHAIARQIAEGYEYYLMMSDEIATGYIGLQVGEDQRLFLSRIYVQASYRGQGLAWQALTFIEERARACSCTAVHLTCNRGNTASIHVYERLGFKHTGTVVMDIGQGFVMDDVTMEKRVPPGE